MGGKLTVMIRQENGETHSFKAHTGRLERHFDGSSVFSETQFMKTVRESDYLKCAPVDSTAHDDYENNSAYFAPYHYGLLLFDFKNKQVYACNGYSCVMTATSKFLVGDMRESMEEYSDSPETFLSYVEAIGDSGGCGHLAEFYDFVKSGSRILHRGRVISEGNKSFLEVLASVLEIPESLAGDNLWREIRRRYDEIRVGYREWYPDFDDIEAQPLGWVIHNGNSSINYITGAFDYCMKEALLSKEDIFAWESYLTELDEGQ
jgi:hypothetical protein